MALAPKDLLKKEPINSVLADAMEKAIDNLLKTAKIVQGRSISFNISGYLEHEQPSFYNKATQDEVIHRFKEVGWRKVRFVDSESDIMISLTCPTYRDNT